MFEQLSFLFDQSIAELTQERWIASSENQVALQWLMQWPVEEQPPLIPWQHITWLTAPAKGGKTHLAQVWQQRVFATPLTIIDCCRTLSEDLLASGNRFFVLDHPLLMSVIEEEALLHFINNLVLHDGYLLITHTSSPHTHKFHLKDLSSRLKSCNHFTIELPKDQLVKQLLEKLFADRHLKLSSEVVEFLSKHVERSYEALYQLVEMLDTASLHHKCAVSIPFAKELLHIEAIRSSQK